LHQHRGQSHKPLQHYGDTTELFFQQVGLAGTDCTFSNKTNHSIPLSALRTGIEIATIGILSKEAVAIAFPNTIEYAIASLATSL
jgi:hypothetical protein